MADLREEIRWQASNDELVWRSPVEDFNSGSTVIVHASQFAVFYMNGQCSEVLEAGMHVLETCEIPFIKRIFQKVTGGRTSFRAQLYYVNRVEIAKLRWGVGHITYKDAKGPVFEIGARGLYNIRVASPRKFIEKINGVDAWFNREEMEDRFRELVASAVDNALVNALYDNEISIIDAARHRVKIAESVRPEVEALLDGYGVALTQFIIERIAVPEDDPGYRELLELEKAEGLQARQLKLEAQREITRAEIEAGRLDITSGAAARKRQREGYTYQDERRFDVLDTVAQNEGAAGNLGSQVMQLGVGLGTAGAVSAMMRDNLTAQSGLLGQAPAVAAPKAAQPSTPCAKCGAALKEGAKFCLECGEKVAPKVAGGVCAKCGNALPQGAKFCLECGEKVLPAGHVACPGCGKVVAQGKFCLECGFSFAPKKVTCACGHVFENEGKFCPECGQPRP